MCFDTTKGFMLIMTKMSVSDNKRLNFVAISSKEREGEIGER